MASRTRTVFLKELRETFRDWRVILSVVISPLLVTPLLILTVSGVAIHKEISGRKETLSVGVVSAPALPGLSQTLAADKTLSVHEVANADDARTSVRDQRVRAVLVVPDDIAAILQRGDQARLKIVVDESNEKSRTAQNRLRETVRKIADKEIERRLEASGLKRASINPLTTEADNVASAEKKSGSALGMILPYILCLMAALGGMTSAFDLCAGEKERGTMETLLVSPASRSEIILGKLGTIGVVSILATISSVLGLSLTIFVGMQAGRDAGVNIQISYSSIVALVVMVVPMVLMTSSLMLLISTFARNQKEAQAYAFPFIMLIVAPAMFSSVLGPENGIGLALVPVLNTALAMKQVLSSIFNLPFLGVALASSAAYAALAMRLVVAMFQRESVLFRT